MSLLVAKMRKNSKEELRVSLDSFNGHELFNARVWFETDDGESRPGKAGLAFKVEKLPEFADAVTAALNKARERGLCR